MARRKIRFPYSRSAQTKLLWLVVVAALVAYRLWLATTPAAPVVIDAGEYRVERVIDGDTLLLANRARVRLIGVDTPETVDPNRPPEPFGHEAAEFTRRAVEGKVVRLEFDRERKDRYERFLAYVYVGDLLVNEELIRAGLSKAETRFHYRDAMKRRFLKAEEEARRERRGIWSLAERLENCNRPPGRFVVLAPPKHSRIREPDY